MRGFMATHAISRVHSSCSCEEGLPLSRNLQPLTSNLQHSTFNPQSSTPHPPSLLGESPTYRQLLFSPPFLWVVSAAAKEILRLLSSLCSPPLIPPP